MLTKVIILYFMLFVLTIICTIFYDCNKIILNINVSLKCWHPPLAHHHWRLQERLFISKPQRTEIPNFKSTCIYLIWQFYWTIWHSVKLVKSLMSSNLIKKQYKTDQFPNVNVFFVSFSFSIEGRQFRCQDSHYCDSIKGKLGKCWSWSKAGRWQ